MAGMHTDPNAIAQTGSLTSTPAAHVLRFCESTRFSGTLGFESRDARGVLPMLNGVPEVAADDTALEQALDRFLSLTDGTYTLTQMLPALDGAGNDGALALRGSLDQTTPSDLLRYCEAAGITGTLLFDSNDRACLARYRRGELVSITVDGAAEADLSDVFGWTGGTYVIRVRSVFAKKNANASAQTPDDTLEIDPEPDPESDTPMGAADPDAKLLKTLEVALVDIFAKSQQRAEAVRPDITGRYKPPPSIHRTATLPFGVEGTAGATPTPLTVPPVRSSGTTSVPPKPAAPSAPSSTPGSTVKVYFVDRGPSRPSTTQHAAAKLGSEAIDLGDGTTGSARALSPESATAAIASSPPPPATPSTPSTPSTRPSQHPLAHTRPSQHPLAHAAVRTVPVHRGLTALFATVFALCIVIALVSLGALLK